ncbi:hypothetical protein ASF27_02805 [Methylobacterium sp. Leaf102]|uniref:flagellin n=1 Tax=Methylobacterium sp. Leaf102 TaxID=1736253 RepID=UPI0006F66AA4|nr:flagellin [Methylobacterium sp. Leaf102]KQP34489.1 hypothetical protein ASF27_02805 [Methylobacterium sp. Leaf102]
MDRAFDNTGALKASSNAIGGSATVSLTGVNNTAKLGLGSTTPANGTFTAGLGAPADAVVSSGTDATDGSSVASVKANTAVSSGVALAANANASFELTLGSGSTTTINLIGSAKTATAAGLVGEIQKAIDNDTGLNGKVKVSLGSDNKLAFSTVASGADQKLTIKAAGTADIGLGLNTAGALKGSGTDKGGSLGASSLRSTLATQFNNLLTQITQQAKDSSYHGVNLLFRNGSNASENTLHVSFNEKNTSALDIQGVKFDAEGLGLTATTGNFQTDEEINAVIEKLTSATTTLRTRSSTFGANLSVVQNRQDFTKNLTNILDTGAANLTNADLDEEAANSQALSTRNSLAVSALSLANQAQQGILQLLR